MHMRSSAVHITSSSHQAIFVDRKFSERARLEDSNILISIKD